MSRMRDCVKSVKTKYTATPVQSQIIDNIIERAEFSVKQYGLSYGNISIILGGVGKSCLCKILAQKLNGKVVHNNDKSIDDILNMEIDKTNPVVIEYCTNNQEDCLQISKKYEKLIYKKDGVFLVITTNINSELLFSNDGNIFISSYILN
jgi:hypothetical protein